jgi:hypothetical protein
VDAHIRRLRRPTYYETERERRIALAEERRRIKRRTTTSPCPTADMLRAAFVQARASTANMIRFGSMLEDLECYVDNSVVWNAEKGKIVGRRGGIRQWLRENAEDLSVRYKTVMKYKALAKRFRQAVGVSDPVPASAVLPPEAAEQGGNTGGGATAAKNRKKESGGAREHRSEQSRGGQTPEAVARSLLAACEGTVASLAAQLALMVSEDFVPGENIARNRRQAVVRKSRNTDIGGEGLVARRVRSSA